MNTLILGNGEIGSSLFRILSDAFPNQVWADDVIVDKKVMSKCPDKVDVLHVCLRHTENFKSIVEEYVKKYRPALVDICTTSPVGTTESFGNKIFVHSTTRGLHPNLVSGFKAIPKHIGGNIKHAEALATYFNTAGVECVVHNSSRTTELLHILNNVHYGVNLMFADEAASLCREYGVDYIDYLSYTQTNNAGFSKLGHQSKVRPVLTPPNGKIGGHCVGMSANLIPREKRKTLIAALSDYGKE